MPVTSYKLWKNLTEGTDLSFRLLFLIEIRKSLTKAKLKSLKKTDYP